MGAKEALRAILQQDSAIRNSSIYTTWYNRRYNINGFGLGMSYRDPNEPDNKWQNLLDVILLVTSLGALAYSINLIERFT